MAGLHVPLSTLRHSPRGPSTHDSGPSWIATPSMSGVLIPFLMPVYPGAFPTFLAGVAERLDHTGRKTHERGRGRRGRWPHRHPRGRAWGCLGHAALPARPGTTG